MMKETPMRGFTLVETLVAITVVVTAMVGPLYAVQQAMNASRSARDQLVASSLAQDGVEFVRGIRDNNYLYVLNNPSSTRSWLFGLDASGGTNCISAACIVDSTQQSAVSRCSGTCAPLRLSQNGLYNQAAQSAVNVPTMFTRSVQLTPVSGSTTEMVVTVTVTWTSRGQARNVTITERLHNWL